ncbi:MAG: hypothetical protein VX641_05810 [Planctomycetota bacterium]|nr:hypothetical protein [Planctomycetota bacterium]
MNPSRTIRRCLGATLLAATCSAAVHAQLTGDTCSDPLQFSGDGVVSIDMSTMIQPSAHNWNGQGCVEQSINPESDAYICWTATVDGLVDVSTCNGTIMDTKLAIFDGCGCPHADLLPNCCSDDDCGKQSFFRCDVKCGERYLILLSVESLQPSNSIVDITFSTVGEPCDTGGPYEPITCEDCCGGIPEVTGFAGLQAISTQWRDVSNDYVVNVYDLDPAGLSAPGTNSVPPTYQHPDWTRDKLGTVFGCAIGGDGTMYVSATSIFFLDTIGSLGGPGSIYRLDGTTGAPSELISLPNQFAQGYPSLGNIAFECNRNILFASNFDDGLVWSIDPVSGTPVDTYRHVDGLVMGPAGDPNDAPGYAPLGARVWAVQPVGDRLYYSVWVEDMGRPDANRNNEVWSVGIDALGQFVPGTRQFEFSSPDIDSQKSQGTNPIADLAQGPDCCLYAAERTMVSDTNSGSHDSRLLVACPGASGGWVIDDAAYTIGQIPDSAAGGVAVDFIDGGSVWATADAALFGGTSGQYAYGIQGTPRPGGDYSSSVQIDLDLDVNGQDKGQIGSLEITCIMASSSPCMEAVQVGSVECLFDENGLTGTYSVDLEVTNLADHDVHYLLIPDASMSPNMVPMSPVLGSGQTVEITVEVTGMPYDYVCVPLVFLDVDGEECCSGEVCFELPECDCAVFTDLAVECIDSAPGVFELYVTVTNLSPDVIEHLYFLPQPGSGTTVGPGYVDIPAMAPFTSTSVGPLYVASPLAPGDIETILVALHNLDLKECCVEPLNFEIPDCGDAFVLGDLNGDGVVNGMDMTILLGAWGSSGPGDFNGDGVVDGADLAVLLGQWGP